MSEESEREEYERQRYEEYCYHQQLAERDANEEALENCSNGRHEWSGDRCGWCGTEKDKGNDESVD